MTLRTEGGRVTVTRREFLAVSLVTAGSIGALTAALPTASPVIHWRVASVAKWLADLSQNYDAVVVGSAYGLTPQHLAAMKNLARQCGITLYFQTAPDNAANTVGDSCQLSAHSVTLQSNNTEGILLTEGVCVRGVVLYDATLCRWNCFTPAGESLPLARLDIARFIDTTRRDIITA